MPIYIDWGNDEHTLLIEKFVEPWTPDELMEMIETGVSMVSSVDHTVDIIIDFQDAKFYVPVKFMPAVKRLKQLGTMNRGMVVIVKAPSFIKSLIRFAREFTPATYVNVEFVERMSSAIELLNARSSP
ncbi:MAG: hypothetical protein LCI00_09495 [Chloroflexi bacterium]|nr:hypothetical protein [Chloroflexota bacterium]MCC6893041.1 hypothetical protein [Anaerolineae bacterium]